MTGYDKYLEFQYRWTGDFYTLLFKAIGQADGPNLEKMKKAFPEEVDAYLLWTREGATKLFERISPDHPLRNRFIAEYNLKEES